MVVIYLVAALLAGCQASQLEAIGCYSDADCPVDLICHVDSRLCRAPLSAGAAESVNGVQTVNVAIESAQLCATASSPVSLGACEASNDTWTMAADDSLRAQGRCLDVTDRSALDSTKLTLASCDGSSSQAWIELDGELIHAASGRCVDAQDGSLQQGAPLQLRACAGTPGQRWRLTSQARATTRELGPRVLVFDPLWSRVAVQRRIDAVFARQASNQFGSQRFAMLFKPGTYEVDVNLGFYTQAAGLGRSPDAASIRGRVHVEADWFPEGTNNATHNFWRAAENLSVTPRDHVDRWAVAQGTAYRRMHLYSDLELDDGGWASGGFMADSQIDGEVRSGAQQQWLSRNSQWTNWSGAVWNMVFVGDIHAPAATYPEPPNTVVERTPIVREKPFLFVSETNGYKVFLPALRKDSRGPSWTQGEPNGVSLPLDDFAVLFPQNSAEEINAALTAGKHLLFTPGIYSIDETLNVTRPDTVVLGLGFATLRSNTEKPVMTVADVDGVTIAGLLIDAGTHGSPVLMRVGEPGSHADHSANPSALYDLFFRIGGSVAGRAAVTLELNSSHVIADNLWLWRADHGEDATVGWDTNPADHGLVVEGDDVTLYGLFVEHYQKQQCVWRGQRGRTYFFQSETPYDVPEQSAWMNGKEQGFASYVVERGVERHEAWGLGAYCFFNVTSGIVLDHAFEVAPGSAVTLRHMVAVSLNAAGTIEHVVNQVGDRVQAAGNPVFVKEGP